MENVKIKGIYKHFKGNLYIVEDIASSADTGDKMVVYRALYGDNELWVRDMKEFLSEVDHLKYPNANQQYRFELQKIDSKTN